MKLNELRIAVEECIERVQESLSKEQIVEGKSLFEKEAFFILTRSEEKFEFGYSESDDQLSIYIDTDIELDDKEIRGETIIKEIFPSTDEWDQYSFACLLTMQLLLKEEQALFFEHKRYSREGMIRRVLEERWQRAMSSDYRIKWADNIYGDHILTNENGVNYIVFLRDFENETGYSNSKDSAVNKLGTTKHIMYAFSRLKESPSRFKRMSKSSPFVEVYCNPLNEYRITYFYSEELPAELKGLFLKYFNKDKFVPDGEIGNFANFFNEAQFFDSIVIRPEVKGKVSDYLENRSLLALQKNFSPNFDKIKAKLYGYQEEGVRFASCRKHAIIADEMGLGKTLQAIAVAIQKKEIFGFSRTLVVCPASLKSQWKKEIEKFSSERALIVEGTPEERAIQYAQSSAFFLIVNYETVLRDQVAMNKAKIDFLILDEAQKVKNYATKTANAIKNIGRKHVLVITGTPIENKLIDLFSIMSILDPHLLGPLWEFSYQHCLFDVAKPNKINAYYNLANLKDSLKDVLLRREKRKVIEQLPNVQQHDIPIGMTPLQQDFHASYAAGIGQIINKKFFTAFDLQRLQQLLTAMRMVCNSTYLVDEATNDSPKLEELKYILLEKLNLKNEYRKVIIFSEWVKMHKLIGQMLLENGIGYSELNGSVPVKKRGTIIKQFEEDRNCKVFLSTEAGGAGLNLQVADILINFELPWNPAKKNQRIGRIDRIGQKSSNLSIFNLITENSIEKRISLGLLVKQNLFDSVLNEDSSSDFVDFTEKGRGQFLQQMKDLADGFSDQQKNKEDEPAIETEIYTESSSAEQLEKPDFTDEDILQESISEVEQNHEPIAEIENENRSQDTVQKSSTKQMEEVLNNGMQFLSGLMKMATGKDVGIEDQKIEINEETGEVTMKFKMPKI